MGRGRGAQVFYCVGREIVSYVGIGKVRNVKAQAEEASCLGTERDRMIR